MFIPPLVWKEHSDMKYSTAETQNMKGVTLTNGVISTYCSAGLAGTIKCVLEWPVLYIGFSLALL